MSFKITGITPAGTKFDVPMTINQSKSFNALKLAKQLQDQYGPGYKEAKTLMGAGKVFDLDAPAIPDDVLDAAGSERPTSPFWRSICY